MLPELAPSQYHAILPLYRPLDFNLVIRSVIEGNTPAWVYADDPIAPRLALLWDRQGAVLVAGDTLDPHLRAELGAQIHNVIVPQARAHQIDDLALFYTPGWETALSIMLGDLPIQPARRLSYRLPTPFFSSAPQAPAGFELRRIDDGLLNSQLVHLDELLGWIDSFWRTPDDFLHTGFGYCALAGDEIASWCLTVFAADSARELGLTTNPAYRGRGLATWLAAACVEHALAHGLAPHWHCWADNFASARVAEKTGFVLEREYAVFKIILTGDHAPGPA